MIEGNKSRRKKTTAMRQKTAIITTLGRHVGVEDHHGFSRRRLRDKCLSFERKHRSNKPSPCERPKKSHRGLLLFAPVH